LDIWAHCHSVYDFVLWCQNGSSAKKKRQRIADSSHPVLEMLSLGSVPAYAELIDYCYGFMMADLPWLN
jgi:hypothetical protein